MVGTCSNAPRERRHPTITTTRGYLRGDRERGELKTRKAEGAMFGFSAVVAGTAASRVGGGRLGKVPRTRVDVDASDVRGELWGDSVMMRICVPVGLRGSRFNVTE